MNLLTIIALMICLSLAMGCASKPPPAPGSTGVFGEKEMTYRRGYYDGVQDGKMGLAEDFERHHEHYKKATTGVFEEAYKLGYQSGEQRAPATEEDSATAYQQGFDAGGADAANEQRPSTQRHRRFYIATTAQDFERGYLRGFQQQQE
ncbi:hypothetical protein BH11VER1_BH11VER1_25430 [soil metagenome]